jgi:tetratricopeptide (TPR) repeat protein
MNPETDPQPGWTLSPEAAQALESMNHEATLQSAEQVEAAALAVMQEATRFMEENPSPDQALEDALARALEALDWTNALAALCQLAAAAEGRGEPSQVFNRQHQASQLLFALARPEEALAAARAATAAARKFNRMSALIGTALQGEAWHLLARGDAAGALACLEESLVHIGTETAAQPCRARALVLRARCRIALAEPTAAAADLEAAWPVLDRMGDSLILAGAQASLAAWHETQAQLHQALGERTAAVEQQRLALTRRRIVGEAPQVGRHVSGPALAGTLVCLAGLLVEAGDPDAAAEARREARDLLHTLGLPAPQS